MKIKTIIADDHSLFIEGIRALIKNVDTIELVGEAENGKMVLELLEKHTVDVVLMDINMPEMNGIEATKRIHEKYPKTKVLALTMFEDGLYVGEMMKAGATGFVLKNAKKEELVEAITRVYHGEKYISQDVSLKLIEKMLNGESNNGNGSMQKGSARKLEITPRELEIIKLIAEELTNVEIAQKLNNSPMTIITHRKNLLRKLGVKNTAGLIRFAIQHGLLEEDNALQK
jgi:DNA-binding NarL/FixJ family response regulator